MEKIWEYAKYMRHQYTKIYHQPLDEMKLHKLLYFLQRESYALYHRPAFKEKMIGWIHGPVSLTVREKFHSNVSEQNDLMIEERMLAVFVLKEYGHYSSFDLSQKTHQELSWKNARNGLRWDEIGTNALSDEDIARDSIKVKPFDHDWGCFLDEFEDDDR